MNRAFPCFPSPRAWLAGCALVFLAAPAFAQSIPLLRPDQFDAALATARAQKQLVLVYVSSRQCNWCRHFENTHLGDPGFIRWVNAILQVIQVDQDNPRHAVWLRDRGLYEGGEVPRYYLLDSMGRRISSSTYAAQFTLLKGVQMFEQALDKRFDFDPARLTQAARELSLLRQSARSVEHRLAYGAMEALTWVWLRNVPNALAAFGPDVKPLLLKGPGPGDNLQAWDEIRLWYAGFWSAYARTNFHAALEVSVKGLEDSRLPQYAWWAAFLSEQIGRPDRAAQFGQLYLNQITPKLPAQHPFRKKVEEWKRAAKR